MDYTLPGILQARILEWVAFPCSRGSSQPKDRTHVSRIAGDSLPAKPQGKPKTTGVGNLSLLQQIFLTQESILLHNLHKAFYKQVILFQINRKKLVLQAFAQIIPFLNPLYKINGPFLHLLHMKMSAMPQKCYS